MIKRAMSVKFDNIKHTKTVIITDDEPFVNAKLVDNKVYQRTIVYDIQPIITKIRHKRQ